MDGQISTNQGRSQVCFCSFTFSSHGRIPHEKLQAIMRLGFKVGYNKDGQTSFESTKPSRSSMISLFDMMGFYDEDPCDSLDYNHIRGQDSVMPSLEPFTLCNMNNSASFEILYADRGEETPASEAVRHQMQSHELNINFKAVASEGIQFAEEHFQGGFKGSKNDEDKQKQLDIGTRNLSKGVENNCVDQQRAEEQNMQRVKKTMLGPRVESEVNEEIVGKVGKPKDNKDNHTEKRIKEEEAGGENDDEEEEEEEEESTFMFDKSVFELFCKVMKNSRIFECVTTAQESNGRISVYVRNHSFSKDISEFRRTVVVKKIYGGKAELSRLVLALTSQFDDRVVLDFHESMKLLVVTAHKDIMKELKQLHPHHFSHSI